MIAEIVQNSENSGWSLWLIIPILIFILFWEEISFVAVLLGMMIFAAIIFALIWILSLFFGGGEDDDGGDEGEEEPSVPPKPPTEEEKATKSKTH